MATKSFNDICVEYAHQLGKGLPLTPAEMCNAVIMYLNAQITEMQGITTALQTAVTEAESSATEAINKADDVSEKVDTLQTTVTEAESNATEALNTANGVSETVNALPKVPKPTTNDNGKVIGVQSGAYALVEQSGGEDIPSYTEITGVTYKQEEGAEISYGDNKINLPIIAGDNVTIDADDINRHIRVGLSKVLVYDKTNVVDFKTFKITDNSGNNIIGSCSDTPDSLSVGSRAHGFNISSASRPTFNGVQNELAFLSEIPKLDNYARIIHILMGNIGIGIAVHDTAKTSPYTKYGYDKIETYGNSDTLQYTLNIPNKNGTIAILDDVPNLSNYSGYIDVINGTGGSGIRVHDTANTSPYTKYGYDKIETYGNSNTLQYTLNIPNKNGTIATLDDIGSSSGSKLYLHNVTISSADNGKIYASAITDFDHDFGSFSEMYNHIGKNVSGYYISGGDYYPIVATNIDERERIYVTVVTNSSQKTFSFDADDYIDDVKII